MEAKVLLAAVVALCACGGSQPSSPASPSSICPSGVTAAFSSIDQKLLKVTCTACHAGALAQSSGGLDLSGDAYAALVNVTAQNLQADPGARPQGLLRVKPSDPLNSLLYQKLLIGTARSPQYGEGMPLNAPGSVCQQVRDALRDWIASGAPNN
jgi:hypothetical protein